MFSKLPDTIRNQALKTQTLRGHPRTPRTKSNMKPLSSFSPSKLLILEGDWVRKNLDWVIECLVMHSYGGM